MALIRKEDAEKCCVPGMTPKQILEKIKELKPAEEVTKGLYEQTKWERDIAIGQLEKLGLGLGEKVDGTVSRWIPCDKMLPSVPSLNKRELGTEYWVTVNEDGKRRTIRLRYKEKEWFWSTGKRYTLGRVEAWMEKQKRPVPWGGRIS